jgi:glycosyltransferase involved in cell wall biosynthesis
MGGIPDRGCWMKGIDVIVLTKNSEHLLQRCLVSIYQNVPVNKLIVVDGFSTDGTLKIVSAFKKQYGNIKVLNMNGSRARAREKGIAEVGTDWFLFVDSDVILSKGWFEKAKPKMQNNVGAIWGVNIDVIPNLTNKRFLNLQRLIARQCFTLRGGTHDTLIRRNLVEDIKIPEHLHTYEDAFIMNWIKDKGFKTVVGENIYCLHFKAPENWNPSNGFSGAILEVKCGLVYSHNFAYMAYYPIFMFYWAMQIVFKNVKKLIP